MSVDLFFLVIKAIRSNCISLPPAFSISARYELVIRTSSLSPMTFQTHAKKERFMKAGFIKKRRIWLGRDAFEQEAIIAGEFYPGAEITAATGPGKTPGQ
jgi:hypothetical protein